MLKYEHSVIVFVVIGIGVVFIFSWVQSNFLNAENKIKAPNHLDIESQSTKQEMAAINNSASNSTNATEQASNETNIVNNSNQSLQAFTNGTVNCSAIK